MKPHTITAVTAILQSDDSVSSDRLAYILAACRDARPGTGATKEGTPYKFLTPKQAAAIMETSVRTVWRLAREGKIRRVKLGCRSTRFLVQDIERLIPETPE